MKISPHAGHERIWCGRGGWWYSSTYPYPRHSKVCAVIALPRSSTATEEPPRYAQRRFARFWGEKSVALRGIRTPISQSSGAWPSHHTGYSCNRYQIMHC